MSDTFCSRSWNSYLVDLEFLKYRMCCKTSWSSVKLGEDSFNSKLLQDRRADHLTGKRHASCKYCWDMEDSNVLSFRANDLKVKPYTTTTSKEYGKSVIEIKVSNVCNMACRYCGPKNSTIWAERLHDEQFSKVGINELKRNEDREALLAQLYKWIESEIDNTHLLIITGGEPSISPQFYDLVNKLDLKNLNITINSSLNIPESYIDKFETVLRKLATDNKVSIRVSLDGTGMQNDWQRQGADWELIKKNYIRLGKIPLYYKIGQTFTPLTMEGLVPLAKFIAETKDECSQPPKFGSTAHIVSSPSPLNPLEWVSSFRDELSEFISIIVSNNLGPRDLINQLRKWLETPDMLPTKATAQAISDWATDHQNKWGGSDWRDIYPKTSGIATKVLNS